MIKASSEFGLGTTAIMIQYFGCIVCICFIRLMSDICLVYKIYLLHICQGIYYVPIFTRSFQT